MKTIVLLIAVGALLSTTGCISHPSQTATAGSNPAWSDNFDQPPGSSPDSSRWAYDLGASGWGNNELQSYTRAPENASIINDVEAEDGRALAIRALKTSAGGYTSARLKTAGKFTTRHGRVEARLKMPNGKGIWPAFWMLGANITSAGWPACGEIDVVEIINENPKLVHGTLHGPGYSGKDGITGTTTLPTGTLDQAYHVYAIEWSPEKIVWFFDGVAYHTVTPKTLPAGSAWVFDDTRFFLILNLAVGGNWPGHPDASTAFPQTFSIDYVRVYSPSEYPNK